MMEGDTLTAPGRVADDPGPSPGPVDIVLEGGGMLGFALLGALDELEGAGFSHRRIAGTSFGAIVAALRAAGWTPAELVELIERPRGELHVDMREFFGRGAADRVPLVGRRVKVPLRQGMYSGRAIERWLEDMLGRRGVRTFGDLGWPDPSDRSPDHPSPLTIVATDVTARRMLVLPRDAPLLGMDPLAMPVALAVRMSMSVPLLLQPVVVRVPGGRRHYVMDGGLTSNFPVWTFRSPGGAADRPTIAFELLSQMGVSPGDPDRPSLVRRGPRGVWDLVWGMFETAFVAQDRMLLAEAMGARLVRIDVRCVGSTEWTAPKGALLEAVRTGADATRAQLGLAA